MELGRRLGNPSTWCGAAMVYGNVVAADQHARCDHVLGRIAEVGEMSLQGVAAVRRVHRGHDSVFQGRRPVEAAGGQAFAVQAKLGGQAGAEALAAATDAELTRRTGSGGRCG